jgi:hypothetical protein
MGEYKTHEVEAIISHKRNSLGNLLFLLKWKKFPDSENTWEKEEHLQCPGLLQADEASLKRKQAQEVEQKSVVLGVGKTPDGHLLWNVQSIDGEEVIYKNALRRQHRPMLLLEWYASKMHFDTSTPLVDTFRTPSKQRE